MNIYIIYTHRILYIIKFLDHIVQLIKPTKQTPNKTIQFHFHLQVRSICIHKIHKEKRKTDFKYYLLIIYGVINAK